MEREKIEVVEHILDENDGIAQKTNEHLTSLGLLTLNVMGAPGVGKTSSIIEMVKELQPLKSYVIEADIESDIDSAKLQALGIETVQINTHGACHLDAPTLQGALTSFHFEQPGIVWIENIGNLVCPAEFQIGEHLKVLIATVTEGSDKPYKYPLAFEKAHLIILNKCDLMPYVEFDENFFMAGVEALNPHAQVIKVSAKEHKGYEEVAIWIREKIELMKRTR